MDDELREAAQNCLGGCLDAVSEHFENVVIFASRFDPETGNTVSTWRGRGNWHARVGQVREWLVKQDAVARVEARREMDD